MIILPDFQLCEKKDYVIVSMRQLLNWKKVSGVGKIAP